jgi:hypothetical protein
MNTRSLGFWRYGPHEAVTEAKNQQGTGEDAGHGGEGQLLRGMLSISKRTSVDRQR